MCQAEEQEAGVIIQVTPAMIKEGVDELATWDYERESMELLLRRVLVAVFGAEALCIVCGAQRSAEGA